MFIAAIIYKRWKQLKCSSTDERMNKMLHIYNEILFSLKSKRNSAGGVA
jgi:hypothetical protein